MFDFLEIVEVGIRKPVDIEGYAPEDDLFCLPLKITVFEVSPERSLSL